jgi:hypothetical protein
MRVHFRKLIFAVLVAPMALWAADRQAGTWKMNLEKSKYTADHPAPKSIRLNIQDQEGGLKVNVDGEDAQGKPIHIEYSAKYDGKDYPQTGSPAADTVAVRRVDADAIEVTNKKGGEMVTMVRSVVSKDGKTRTSTWTGKDAKGVPETWIVVFDKQ